MVEFVAQLPPPTIRQYPIAVGGPHELAEQNREVAAELRARPGEWAIYPRTFPTQQAAHDAAGRIRRGRAAAFGAGFDAAARDGRVYVRFIGDPTT